MTPSCSCARLSSSALLLSDRCIQTRQTEEGQETGWETKCKEMGSPVSSPSPSSTTYTMGKVAAVPGMCHLLLHGRSGRCSVSSARPERRGLSAQPFLQLLHSLATFTNIT
ncbi:hypothetical protein GDO81_021835 [Engystomops pustulosus]|uniref:Uncharacterized protein n=1 Tax=Engystomops pustulosus TaxID=76066 RepID=A0AAV6ZFZ9_ENGPU|nr:hypothetical protein GDO81_021835 [Engystomops pustulosus]